MRFLHNILAKAGLIVDGVTQLNTIANATIDTDKFLVSDGGVIKYRTGAQLGSDIGAANIAASTLKHQVKLGEAINKGQAVYVSSADGTNMIVSKASNASEPTSSKTLGLIETSGVLNDQVNVVTEGLLAGLDTSTAAAGDPVWLGTGGNLIFGLANKPYAPAHLVFIGIVTRVQQNNGEIFVKVQNGFELKEIHDVQITTTPSDNTVLAYETATSLYKMKSIATLLGYTPANAARQLTINGTTYDLTVDRTWSVGTVTSIATTGPITGGTITGSGTIGITQATTSSNGYLSSTDWNTFNNKQNALTLTTTGSSGASTLVGATLNIPTYSLSGLGGVPSSRQLTINGTAYDLSTDRSWSVGTVTSVGVSAPTGLSVSNTPVTGSGTIAISFTAGYSIPTTASQTNWDTAYNNRITSLTTTGTSGAATLTSNTLNIPQYQAQGNYITSLTGEATASGPGSASVTLTNSAVIGKVLTGLNVTGGSISATDSILTAFGKLQNQVNGLAGGVTYQGTWNASTNSPSLTSSVGTKGYYYVVSVAGSTNLNGITDWKLGDWAIFNGTSWEKVDNTDAVVSVNGFTGAVSLTTSNISEGTNLYYTDARARAAISLTTTGSSGAATYIGGVINVPQYTLAGLGGVPTSRQLTINGTSYDLSADRTWTITNISGTAGSETLTTVTSRGNSTTDRINVRGVGNQGGGNIMMGNTGEGTSKWSYLTGTHYNATSQSQGFALIGGLSTSTSNSVVIGGNIYETNPATEIQFWTHTATTHNLGGTQRGVINSSGNWGIGNLSPTYRLDVGTPNDNAIRIINSAGSNNNGIALSVGSGTPWIDFWGSVFDIKYNTSPGSWNGGNNRYVTITSGGNVGLTNTNPAYKLHVAGDIYADGGWLRVSGQSGLYFESYGGGWNMSDTTFLRSYNSKSIYSGTGIFRTDAGDTGFQNVGTANWYMLDFGDRSASSGRYGVGLTSDVNNRTLSFHVPNHAAYSSSGNVPQFGWYSNGADQLMTLQSATGNLWTKGTISMAGNLVATQSWVTSQGYITSASVGNGTLTLNVSGSGLSGSTSFTANQSGNTTFTVTSNATTSATANTIAYRDSGGDLYARYFFGSYVNTSDNDETGITRFVIKNGDNYHRSATSTTAMTVIRGVASGTWGIDISGNSATTTNFRHLGAGVSYDNDRTTKVSGGLAVYAAYSGGSNSPTTYDVAAQFSVNGNRGFEICADWLSTAGPTLYARSLRDCCQNWSSWVTILTSLNYNSYSPTLTGGGASGTWGISISGNSATTSQTNFTTLTLNSATVATQSWVQSQGYVTGGPYLPLSGGTMTGALAINSTAQAFTNVTLRNTTSATAMPTQLFLYMEARYNSGANGTNIYHWIRDSWEYNITNNYSDVTIGAFGNGTTYGAHFRVSTDGQVYATNSFRAPIFYDTDNTAYYGNFAGTSVMNSIRFGTSTNNTILSGNSDWGVRFSNDVGYIQIGPANGSYAHIYTDRGSFYMNVNDLYLNGNLVPAYGYNRTGDLYASRYYDSNDTGYYGDFASTSNINIINAQGLATANALYFAGAYGNTYNSDAMYIQGRYISSNVQALDIYIGDDGRNSVLPLPTGGQDGSVDSLCIRATNDGIHHIFDSAGDAWHARHLYVPNGNLTVGGTITEQSSLRFKENVAPIEEALSKVNKLNAVSYNKIGSKENEIGLIAEDVFNVYPEFVLCDESGKPLGIHYSRLTAVLIESVKELKKEINQLKNKN
jgi:predicted heme/steroid binding protein